MSASPDFRKMYLTLFNAVEKALELIEFEPEETKLILY